jgi:hypothetical protein
MKVDVLTVKDVKFKKFSWWSDWVDVAIYDYSSRPYLLQMSINRFNRKRFNSICLTGLMYRQSSSSIIGSLTQMESPK